MGMIISCICCDLKYHLLQKHLSVYIFFFFFHAVMYKSRRLADGKVEVDANGRRLYENHNTKHIHARSPFHTLGETLA